MTAYRSHREGQWSVAGVCPVVCEQATSLVGNGRDVAVQDALLRALILSGR